MKIGLMHVAVGGIIGYFLLRSNTGVSQGEQVPPNGSTFDSLGNTILPFLKLARESQGYTGPSPGMYDTKTGNYIPLGARQTFSGGKASTLAPGLYNLPQTLAGLSRQLFVGDVGSGYQMLAFSDADRPTYVKETSHSYRMTTNPIEVVAKNQAAALTGAVAHTDRDNARAQAIAAGYSGSLTKIGGVWQPTEIPTGKAINLAAEQGTLTKGTVASHIAKKTGTKQKTVITNPTTGAKMTFSDPSKAAATQKYLKDVAAGKYG